MVALTEDSGAAKLAYGLQRDLLGEVERRPWLPHVTVLRFRSRPRLRPEPPDLGAFRTSDAAVYHSVLRSAGAQYEVLESVALGGQ
jgi:2'-5' RNA ligase